MRAASCSFNMAWGSGSAGSKDTFEENVSPNKTCNKAAEVRERTSRAIDRTSLSGTRDANSTVSTGPTGRHSDSRQQAVLLRILQVFNGRNHRQVQLSRLQPLRKAGRGPSDQSHSQLLFPLPERNEQRLGIDEIMKTEFQLSFRP